VKAFSCGSRRWIEPPQVGMRFPSTEAFTQGSGRTVKGNWNWPRCCLEAGGPTDQQKIPEERQSEWKGGADQWDHRAEPANGLAGRDACYQAHTYSSPHHTTNTYLFLTTPYHKHIPIPHHTIPQTHTYSSPHHTTNTPSQFYFWGSWGGRRKTNSKVILWPPHLCCGAGVLWCTLMQINILKTLSKGIE